jgi:hypothetical protein
MKEDIRISLRKILRYVKEDTQISLRKILRYYDRSEGDTQISEKDKSD